MTLTQQFLLLTIMPAIFAFFAGLVWYTSGSNKHLVRRWGWTLLLWALWSSSILSYFSGELLTAEVDRAWRVIARYMYPLGSSFLLLSTASYIVVVHKVKRRWLWLAFAGVAFALAIDPIIVPYTIADRILTLRNGQYVWHHFDIWVVVWATSILFPIGMSWLYTYSTVRKLPQSQYRNQLYYWLLGLIIILMGTPFGMLHLPQQPGWQQLGVMGILTGALIGTISIVRSPLPDLQTLFRKFAVYLFELITIVALTWLGLWALQNQDVELIGSSPVTQVLLLSFFALLLFGLVRIVHWVTKQVLRTASTQPALALEDGEKLTDALLNLEELASVLIRLVQVNMNTEDVWLFRTEEGPQGQLILRPLANSANHDLQTVALSATSAFTQQLRRQPLPIVQYDIDTLPAFADMDRLEKNLLRHWGRTLYMPLHAGKRIVGLFALPAKINKQAYDEADYARLMSFTTYAGPIFWRAMNIEVMNKAVNYAFLQARHQTQASRHLSELTRLYQHLGITISPSLRQQFNEIDQSMKEIASQNPDVKIADIMEPFSNFRHNVEQLIRVTGQLQKQNVFQPERIQMDVLLRKTIDNLHPLANGRQVKIQTNIDIPLPAIRGDYERLQEAIQSIIHNAIKFNRVGGIVKIHCGLSATNLFVHIQDNGVGMPPEKQFQLWQGVGYAENGQEELEWHMSLPIAHFILKSHGGNIEVESMVGEGSKFSVYLPIVLDDV